MKNKNQKGITLVALVITIIVLLILAGVAINMAINSDGLFRKANEAVDQYGEARKNESTAISDLFDKLTEIETGIKIEQVTDTKPGELEGTGTEADPYTINSIEDLVFFSQDVRNGNTYAEEYVKLGLSLDFNSNKSYVDPYRTDYAKYGYDGELKTLLTTGEGFKPIGRYEIPNDSTKNFAGTFDGNEKLILNLYINVNSTGVVKKIGLFGINSGYIKNLGLENVKINTQGIITDSQIGSIAGQNGSAGIIEKCYVKGKIVASSVSIGGITGYCSGTITDCYNSISINNNYNDENGEDIKINVGGIASNLGSSGTIINCYNTGIIEESSSSDVIQLVRVGGIAGLSEGNITSSYNDGEILIKTSKANLFRVGGVLGANNGTIEKCYAKGNLRIDSNELEELVKGGVVGYYGGGTISNCSYLSSIAEKGVGSGTDTTTAVEKESDMPSILSVVGEAFKEDSNNINNGYPILDWQ